jgi:hypothetical protein
VITLAIFDSRRELYNYKQYHSTIYWGQEWLRALCVLLGCKGVIRIRKSKNRQHNVQKKKDKQRSTKHTHIGIC